MMQGRCVVPKRLPAPSECAGIAMRGKLYARILLYRYRVIRQNLNTRSPRARARAYPSRYNIINFDGS